jgi:hypothetical protein
MDNSEPESLVAHELWDGGGSRFEALIMLILGPLAAMMQTPQLPTSTS